MSIDLVVRLPGGAAAVRRFAHTDLEAARASAVAEGLEVIDVVGSASVGGPRRRRIRQAADRWDHGTLAEQLGTLLQAGLGMLEAIDALAAGDDNAARRAVLSRISASLHEGRALSDAMAATGAFPLLLVASVKASERTGHLVDALLRHAEHDRRVRELRSKLISAAIYPILLLTVGTAVVLFLLGFVVPRFAVLIDASRADLPWASRWLMSFGVAVSERPAVPAIVLAASLLVMAGAGVMVARGGLHGLIRHLPYLGRLSLRYRIAQTYRTAGLLVRGGIPIVQALQQCGDVLGNLDRTALDAAVQRLREGVALSVALTEAGLADPVTARMLGVAERTGTLSEVLERIAAMQETQLQRTMDAATRLIEPLLMLSIGLVIGAIVVLMYLPIFDLASQVQ